MLNTVCIYTNLERRNKLFELDPPADPPVAAPPCGSVLVGAAVEAVVLEASAGLRGNRSNCCLQFQRN